MSFRIASKEAAKSQHKHRLGAVVVKNNRVLSTGFNKLRPSSVLKVPTLHAEAAAILKLLKEGRLSSLAGSEIYVTRFTKGGSIGMAKPCKCCMDLIRSVGIRKIHYTNNVNGVTTESSY